MNLKKLRNQLEELTRVVCGVINEIDAYQGRGAPKDVSSNGVQFVEEQYCPICDTLRGVSGACPHQLREDSLRNEPISKNPGSLSALLINELEKNEVDPRTGLKPGQLGMLCPVCREPIHGGRSDLWKDGKCISCAQKEAIETLQMPKEMEVPKNPYNVARMVAGWLPTQHDRERAVAYIDKMEQERTKG